ncbi:MAG: branched-chain amino acid ABC transporter permease [Acidimicrobiia bacterium]|nr:MAG: branched-chain amino acid ABC transporter permease [Acidimicrobiia bacterium]
MDKFLILLLTGLTVGSIYSMVALGFVLVFKSTDVLNFAHGEFLMLGSYLALTFLVSWDLNIWISILIIAALICALGVGIHFGIMRPLIGQPLFSVVLVTIGIAIIIRAGLLIIYGPLERGRITQALPQSGFDVAGVPVPWVNMIMFVVAALSVLVFLLFFKMTRIGLQMRAVAENLEAAAAMGVSPNSVFATSWGIGAVMAAVAGVLYANYAPVIDLNLSAIGLRAFPAAMIGGLDSVGGAILGGLIVGVLEQLAAGYIGAEYRDVVAFGLMFVVLMVRPFGFFGKEDVIRV